MSISDDRIEDFINRWEVAFGVRLTKDQAIARAHELVELYRELSRSLPAKKQEDPAPPAAEEG